MSYKYLHLIRHGEVKEAYQGKFVGRIDVDLSPEGRRQMRRLTDFCKKLENPKYILSPLKRAQDSFRYAVEPQTTTPIIDGNFQELHFGNWEGLTFLQIRRRYPDLYKEWKSWNPEFRFPQGESHAEFLKRIRKCARLIRRIPNQNIVVFSHGGVIRFLICHFLGLDPEKSGSFKVSRGSKSTLDIARREAVLLDLNVSGPL